MTDSPVALVTGATSGTGIDIAKRLVDDGFLVVVSGRSADRGETVAKQLGDGAVFVRSDLRDSGEGRRLVRRAVEELGHLDVLVNNAGVDHTGDLLEATEDEIRSTFETNTFGAMNLVIAAARVMRDQGDGGVIVNITSRLASIGVPTM